MDREKNLLLAGKLAPELKKWIVPAKNVVDLVKSPKPWQQTAAVPAFPAENLPDQMLAKGERIVLDFGETLVGKVRLRLECLRSIDSPVKLKFLAAELPYEAAGDPETFESGLGRGWLQEDMITVYELPAEIELPYRWSFRYLVVDVIACPHTRFRITKAEAIAQSSAGQELPAPLPGWEREMRLIDEACARTLRNCMQDFPEDGPKRDRRLWLGDLRLQALVNHVTFRRYDQFERGIQFLAGCTDDRGMIPAAVMMSPEPHGSSFILDYSLIFARLLLEHCRFSGNPELGGELFEAAEKQLDFFRAALDENLGFHHPGGWLFIDHCQKLDRTAPMVCAAIWGAEALAELAELLNRPAGKIDALRQEADSWRKALRASSFDPELGMLRSGYERQLSWASQIWGALAGVLSPEEARAALVRLPDLPDAVGPQTPYLMHYFLEACRACGAEDLLENTIRRYWGGMIRHGADTFWEAYREDDDFYTPYGNDPRNNSACHAWSSTPSFFLRTKGKF